MAQLTLSFDLTGGVLVRGLAPDNTQLGNPENGIYKSTPTQTDPLIVNVKDNSQVKIWFKANGYQAYYTSVDFLEDDITLHIDDGIDVNEYIHTGDLNQHRSLSLRYEGGYGFIQYGYGLDDPNTAASAIDALFSAGQGLRLIADYDSFEPDLNNSGRYEAGDIAVPMEVGRITSFTYHDERFYFVGGEYASTDNKLYRYKMNSNGVLEKEGWATNPQSIVSAIDNQAELYTGGMAVWNGKIYVPDGAPDNNRIDTGKAMSVYDISTGAHLGKFTPGIPNGFPKGTNRARFYISGVAIDEARDIMLIAFRNQSSDEFITTTRLRNEFLDTTENPAGSIQTTTFGTGMLAAGETFDNITVKIAVDDTGILYLGRGTGNVTAYDLNENIQLPEGGFTTSLASTAIAIYRGVILSAVPSGTNRGLRAYAMPNRKFTKSGDKSGTEMRIRHPSGGENTLGEAPFRITADGVIFDYDFMRIIPDSTLQWRRRSLNAPILSRYGGIHLPHWVDDGPSKGRVYLCDVDFHDAREGTLTDDTISAIAEKVKMELPTQLSIADQVWRTILDATNNQPAAQYPDRQVNTVAYFLKQAHDRIGINKTAIDNTKTVVDATKTEVDKIKIDTDSLKTSVGGIDTKSTEIDAIKTQTDKLTFNAANEVGVNDDNIQNAIISTNTLIEAIDRELGVVKSTADSIKTTTDALTLASIAQAVWAISADAGVGVGKNLKDIINMLGIHYAGDEELIDAGDSVVSEKSLAVGYAIKDRAGRQRFTKKAKTSTDGDTIPASDDAVKLVRSEK